MVWEWPVLLVFLMYKSLVDVAVLELPLIGGGRHWRLRLVPPSNHSNLQSAGLQTNQNISFTCLGVSMIGGGGVILV